MNERAMKVYMQKVAANVQKFGWHIQGVGGDESFPQFAYTVGLTKTLGHPEVLVVGIPSFETMMDMLNQVGWLVKKTGARFEHGSVSADVVKGFMCRFLRIDAEHHDDQLGMAHRFYEGREFSALQCVWPDKDGLFPWDAGVTEGMNEQQPLLGAAPTIQ